MDLKFLGFQTSRKSEFSKKTSFSNQFYGAGIAGPDDFSTDIENRLIVLLHGTTHSAGEQKFKRKKLPKHGPRAQNLSLQKQSKNVNKNFFPHMWQK